MLENIETGQTVHVTITREPTNASARKTLTRLLSKDPAVAKEEQRRKQVREANKRKRIRAGRPWIVRPVKKPALAGRQGESGTLRASYDVLKDLKSVERFVEVKPA
jgi:hypothetical protein